MYTNRKNIAKQIFMLLFSKRSIYNIQIQTKSLKENVRNFQTLKKHKHFIKHFALKSTILCF